MTEPRLTAIDFNAGIGGHSIVCKQNGITVLAAIENDDKKKEIFSVLQPHVPVFSKDSVERLPPADILVATLSFGRKLLAESNDDLSVLNVFFDRNRPKAFAILLSPTPPVQWRSYCLEALYTAFGGEYEIAYRVFSEYEYSGFPVQGKQLYMVGIRQDIHERFEFPKTHFDQPIRGLPLEEAERIALKDRNVRLHNRLADESAPFFYPHYYPIKTNKPIHSSRYLISGVANDCCLIDRIGPRRLSPGEYAKVKGIKGYAFNNYTNRSKIFEFLIRSPDCYVAHALLGSIKNFLASSPIEIRPVQSKPIPRQVEEKPTEKPTNFTARTVLQGLHIDKLKGLKNLDVSFGEGLTAIMGVNGVGKSTILHALACMFSPAGEREQYQFGFFFTPTSSATWTGSSFSSILWNENTRENERKEYYKKTDRWSPRSDRRPKRNVYYLGIDTALPAIEKERQTTFIDYTTHPDDDKMAARIIAAANKILHKDYEIRTLHKTKNKSFFGVRTRTGIVYSTLSMGAGEQRVFEIVSTVLHAPQYSLILIDELDLLLHVYAQQELVKWLSEKAKSNRLQIVFTTHSLEIGQMKEHLHLQYLYQTVEKTLVYDHVTTDIVYDISRREEKPLTVYVEDDLSREIVYQITHNLNIAKYVRVQCIGSAANAFTLAAAIVIDETPREDKLIVLDGDVYRTEQEKEEQIKKRLSGSEQNHEKKIQEALSIISQFTLPEGVPPEKHLHSMLIRLRSSDECIECAKKVVSPEDSHGYLNEIVDMMHQDRSRVLYQIIQHAAESEEWGNYIDPVRKWLIQKRTALSLSDSH